jgi:hypothetical protein
MSAALRGGRSPDPGTKATCGFALRRAASVSRRACNAGSARASWSGEVRRGQIGVSRSTISAQVTRSCVRSIAGGTEVSEAAAKKIATPMPISTSA